jgi:hypothetical protein
MQKNNKHIAIVLLLFLYACGPQLPKPKDSPVSTTPTAYGMAKALSDTDYNALSNDQKYVVANKLLGTLYKGIPINLFFDASAGMSDLKLKAGKDYVSSVQGSLLKPLDQAAKAATILDIEKNYTFDVRTKPIQYPLAMLYEFPVSQDYFNRWIAYKLANTILFSPALENDSVGFPDIQAINYRLVTMLDAKKSIREMVYDHFVSQENWRRFRSPEDNVREMIEVFLGLFDRDADVPRGATACQNWYLTEENQGYQLVIGFDENAAIQTVLDTGVINCYDFYRVLSQHPLLIPRMTTILVNTFFMGFPVEKNTAIVNAIVAAKPKTFQDIFLMMLFSKEYLLNVERPKEFEETFFNIAGRIYWEPSKRLFSDFADTNSQSLFPTMKNMGQAPLTYKLGRFPEIPQDAVGFGFYHKAVREKLLIDRKTNNFDANDGGWKSNFVDTRLTGNDFINYIFLSVISRQATTEELTTLGTLIKDLKLDNDKDKPERAIVVLDYLSRLTETYNFKAIL